MPSISREIALAAILAGTLAIPASAQPAPPPDPAPNTPAAPPPVAPPAPDASPKQVEDAKEIANQAKLTPIVPSPNNPTRPAFQLYAEIDIPVLAVGLVFAGARIVKTQKAFCAPICDQKDLNSLDRLTAGYWNPTWALSSDFGLYGLAIGAAALLTVDEGALAALNDTVVLAESTFSAAAVSSIMTLAAGRPRPFVFGDPTMPDAIKAPLSNRNSPDAGLSFLSGHTTQSFAIVTSLYIAERRLHPHSRRSKVILGVGLATASFVGLARIMSGNHFITDVVGGAIVGSAVGVLVSSVHGSPVSVVPVASRTEAGLALQGRF